MEILLQGLRAVGESTRLRLLFILSHGEFNVSELTHILGQSQPRVSRHLKLMSDAGLLERYKEGSWVMFRRRDEDVGGALARLITDLLPAQDALLKRDLERLTAVLEARQRSAAAYFSANARHWDTIRSLHVAEADLEVRMRELAGPPSAGCLLDLGTGTGRILELLGPLAGQAIGIDASREMLALARARIETARLRHAQVRHADIYALPYPNGFADIVTIHLVLHFLEDPGRAVAEALRVLSPQGRLIVADFAPHGLEFLREQHAHRRLGISGEHFAQWVKRAGGRLERELALSPPESLGESGLTVNLWLVRRGAETEPHAEGRLEREDG